MLRRTGTPDWEEGGGGNVQHRRGAEIFLCCTLVELRVRSLLYLIIPFVDKARADEFCALVQRRKPSIIFFSRETPHLSRYTNGRQPFIHGRVPPIPTSQLKIPSHTSGDN